MSDRVAVKQPRRGVGSKHGILFRVPPLAVLFGKQNLLCLWVTCRERQELKLRKLRIVSHKPPNATKNVILMPGRGRDEDNAGIGTPGHKSVREFIPCLVPVRERFGFRPLLAEVVQDFELRPVA